MSLRSLQLGADLSRRRALQFLLATTWADKGLRKGQKKFLSFIFVWGCGVYRCLLCLLVGGDAGVGLEVHLGLQEFAAMPQRDADPVQLRPRGGRVFLA